MTLASMPLGGVVEADIELTYRKVFWRIVPFLMWSCPAPADGLGLDSQARSRTSEADLSPGGVARATQTPTGGKSCLACIASC